MRNFHRKQTKRQVDNVFQVAGLCWNAKETNYWGEDLRFSKILGNVGNRTIKRQRGFSLKIGDFCLISWIAFKWFTL